MSLAIRTFDGDDAQFALIRRGPKDRQGAASTSVFTEIKKCLSAPAAPCHHARHSGRPTPAPGPTPPGLAQLPACTVTTGSPPAVSVACSENRYVIKANVRLEFASLLAI